MPLPAGRGPESTCGHGCYPPTIVTGNSGTVFINGLPALKVSSPMTVHTCVVPVHPSHGSTLAAGSGTVSIEGSPAGRIGDPTGCGDACASASSNVFIG